LFETRPRTLVGITQGACSALFGQRKSLRQKGREKAVQLIPEHYLYSEAASTLGGLGNKEDTFIHGRKWVDDGSDGQDRLLIKHLDIAGIQRN
jgi:hypothetical protein